MYLRALKKNATKTAFSVLRRQLIYHVAGVKYL